MTTSTRLPHGARAVAMDGSNRYTARPGDTVQVSDGTAARLAQYARSRHSGERFTFGTKTGRRCVPCRRVWNAWNVTCPRCGTPTVPAEGG